MELNDLFGFKGKSVVVTGTGSGMGHAAAELLVDLGAHVTATTHRRPLDLAVETTVACDLSTKEGCDKLIVAAPEHIDALFLCHGTADEFGGGNALEVQLTNFWSFKYLAESLLPRIVDWGSVTFISSNGGKFWRDHVNECLELADRESWDEALAWYEGHPDLTHLGLTKTGLTEAFERQIDGNAENGRAVIESLYLDSWNGRYATPEEMGWPMVAIGSKLFSYMSGQIVYIDYGCASEDEMNLLVD